MAAGAAWPLLNRSYSYEAGVKPVIAAATLMTGAPVDGAGSSRCCCRETAPVDDAWLRAENKLVAQTKRVHASLSRCIIVPQFGAC